LVNFLCQLITPCFEFTKSNQLNIISDALLYKPTPKKKDKQKIENIKKKDRKTQNKKKSSRYKKESMNDSNDSLLQEAWGKLRGQ
jgi:hypothetical protein